MMPSATVRSRQEHQTTVPVLLYHSVSDTPAAEIAPYTVSPAMFERHLDLVARGRNSLTVSQLADCLTGAAEWPADPVVITFDDGFADNLEIAAPMLSAHDVRATVYVTTGYVGRVAMVGWSQVTELDAMGVEIGAHAHTHTPLDELPPGEAIDEIRGSKELLEDRLGHAVPSFAYPHGYSDARVRREVSAAGFRSACGVRNALSHTGDDRWNIARLTVRPDTSLGMLERWLSGQSAPVARPHEAPKTRVWRAVRRLRRGRW